MAPLIRDLAIILGTAGLVSLIFQRIRQPVVLGYIIAGILVGPYLAPFPIVTDLHGVQIWADLGVAFLMFSLGLEFSFRRLAKVGVSVGITAAFEVLVMLDLGFACGKLLHWNVIDSLFLGGMMAIASTTMIVKALDELGLKTRRFAQMIYGVLIVEDLAAVLILVTLSTLVTNSAFSSVTLLLAAGKLILVIGTWFLAGYFVLPRFMRYVGQYGTDEMLTVISLGLCLILVVVAAHFGYSIALGAFIMGSILAESSESHRIEELIHPIRDIFAAVFFVSVGMLMDPRYIFQHWGAILVITVALIVGKIVATTVGALITGQTLRTAIQVGFGLAQIGEFSFIIAGLGKSLHVTSDFLYPVAAVVSLITAFTTPYLIRSSHKFAVALEGHLPVGTKDLLVRYVAWAQQRRADVGRRAEFHRLLLRWLLNGILVTMIFTLVAGTMAPTRLAIAALWWAGAVLLSAPFIWGMYSAFRGFRFGQSGETGESGPRGGTLFLSRLLTALWIGALTFEFFPARFALLITIALAAILFIAFYRQLEASYQWFERTFLSTFTPTPKTRQPLNIARDLAPWDAHLVRIKVHPNAEVAGLKLCEFDFKVKYGLNVVAIQRGLKTIVAPGAQDQIFPKDELLVLGTDEQVEMARVAIEKPPGLADRFRDLSGYELREFRIEETSELAGLPIRDSGIRDCPGAMIVGIERGGRRILNPEPDLILRLGDVLWIVGETEAMNRLVNL